MPTKYPRIAVTRDPEFDEALVRARPILGNSTESRLVRDLAIRGADVVVAEEQRRHKAVEEIERWFREPETAPWDWDVLARVEELAWPHDVDDE